VKNEKPYLACPYCLSAIKTETEEPLIEASNVKLVQEAKIEEPKEPSATKCPHHFGYLSKRSGDGKIPESCMMCEKIVQCMLKNMTQ